MFQIQTRLGAHATLSLARFERHIHMGSNYKFGWARVSGFEIKKSLTDPMEVYVSGKDPNSHYYVSEVGEAGTTKWYTISFLDHSQQQITTAYNTVKYSQKGDKLWPQQGGV